MTTVFVATIEATLQQHAFSTLERGIASVERYLEDMGYQRHQWDVNTDDEGVTQWFFDDGQPDDEDGPSRNGDEDDLELLATLSAIPLDQD